MTTHHQLSSSLCLEVDLSVISGCVTDHCFQTETFDLMEEKNNNPMHNLYTVAFVFL